MCSAQALHALSSGDERRWQNPGMSTSGASRSQAVPGTEAACLSHTLVSIQSRQAMDCIPMHSYSQGQLPPSHVLPLLFTGSFQQVSLQEMSTDSALCGSVPSWCRISVPDILEFTLALVCVLQDVRNISMSFLLLPHHHRH